MNKPKSSQKKKKTKKRLKDKSEKSKKRKTKKRLKAKHEKPKKRKTKKRLKAKHEKPKKRKTKKKKKSQDPKRLRDIQIPFEHQIPQCQVCKEKKADCYCTKCDIHYCQYCEPQVHTTFSWKKHINFIYREPYVSRKKINSNLCYKHKKELSLYCKDDNKLICTKCYETCRINNHSILGLDEYSNEISEKIKMILNKIQKAEIQNNETIQKSIELKNKFKIEIKELSNLIENQSDLMIQKIQKSKINHLNLLLKIEIITDTKFDQIMNKNQAKQEARKETKKKIKIMKKLEKDKKTIKFLRESNEIIEKDKEERGKDRKREQQRKREIQREKESKEIYRLNQRKKREEEIRRLKEEKKKKRLEENEREKILEEFDPKMNSENLIKLKNENKTAWNPSSEDGGIICGKKIYSRGKHQIKIKIDQFPNPENEWNWIWLGVIKTENRKKLIENTDLEKTYFFESYFQTDWAGQKNQSEKVKKENGKETRKNYPKKIYFKKNDIFEIFLDMDQKKISFKLNEKNLEGWENLPEKVNFFAYLQYQKGKEKNQITII
ncbi:tripartite motif-containing protein [Anaeramoeba flamelloides]|uniref:Tripartite motif-containing protein n=1 Tax=Anaeramoeba flamelloides TaxID=1746091 RepID=A0ABQ8XYV2_9EUKA|nr:tripartite motif-containing protein [Anaeramoeba flamelloides]